MNESRHDVISETIVCCIKVAVTEIGGKLKSTLVVDNDTTLHGVHSDTIAISPNSLDQVQFLFLSTVTAARSAWMAQEHDPRQIVIFSISSEKTHLQTALSSPPTSLLPCYSPLLPPPCASPASSPPILPLPPSLSFLLHLPTSPPPAFSPPTHTSHVGCYFLVVLDLPCCTIFFENLLVQSSLNEEEERLFRQ